MKQTPLSRYQQDLEQAGFVADQAQLEAVLRLQALFEALTQAQSGGWLRWFKRGKPKIKSVYFWGGVGRGKTYLMDAFYDTLPFEAKMRTHFHRFMRHIHAELTELKGEKNPLDKVAEQLSDRVRVICFDEFFVSDITDAMILANLLKGLFDRGMVLVMTSNIQPDGLYRDGLQRERFLPAIALLNQHADVINVDGGVDYRLRELQQVTLYHTPNDAQTQQTIADNFAQLVPDTHSIQSAPSLTIEGRPVRAIQEADDVVWFDFKALCDGPRSQHDYIVLAKEYHTVFVTGVPALGRKNDDMARRFVYLVDEFYDRKVKLILSADLPLTELYSGGKLNFEFERTVSRLLEMQSEDYLASAHRP